MQVLNILSMNKYFKIVFEKTLGNSIQQFLRFPTMKLDNTSLLSEHDEENFWIA